MESSHSEMNGVADQNHSEPTSEQDSLINSTTTEAGTTLRHRLDPEPKREEDEDGSKQAQRGNHHCCCLSYYGWKAFE